MGREVDKLLHALSAIALSYCDILPRLKSGASNFFFMLLLHCLSFRERFAGSHWKVPDSPTRLDLSYTDMFCQHFKPCRSAGGYGGLGLHRLRFLTLAPKNENICAYLEGFQFFFEYLLEVLLCLGLVSLGLVDSPVAAFARDVLDFKQVVLCAVLEEVDYACP